MGGYYRKLSAVLFVFLFQLAFSSSIPHLCLKHESIALLNFKNTLTAGSRDFYSKTSRWNMSRDCCLWDGVKCDELSGHVIELDLRFSSLVGAIDSNSTLFQLSHLQRLDLSANDFSASHISPRFGSFSSLTHLDLSYSGFSGQIPSEMSHLSKLHSLVLSSNPDRLRLAAHDFKLLLKNLTQLRVLVLFNVNISSTIHPNMSSHMTTLLLDSTGLHGILPQHIFHLPNLEVLSLGGNDRLSGSLPKTKWNSSASLMSLDLSSVTISGNLPESLGYLTSLVALSLQSCDLGGPIPEPLSNLTRIESLDLQGNTLSGKLPSWIFCLQSLRYLYLSSNHFSGQLEDFKSNSLEVIRLEENQLQGHLPMSIQNLVNLTYLSLGFNNFSGHVDVSLFSNLKQLSFLSLSYNKISLTSEHEDKSTLPDSLYRLELAGCEVRELELLRSAKHLRDLDLSNNQIQGEIPDWAWSNWNFSLTRLNLSHNMLTTMDSIPLQFLSAIDLRSNFLQGPLPIPPTSTSIFFISHNNLSAEIPLSICNLTFLKILDLGRNNLNGKIPQCLGNMSAFLEVLDMHQNNLSGTLPTTFSNQSSLRSLNLHGNKLEGKIPRSLANCKRLQVVDLGSNHLNDTFPMWLGTLPELQVLILRANKMHGSIETSNTRKMFPGLRILDLSHNAYMESLPTSLFQHFKAMRTIDRTTKAPTYLGTYYYQDFVTVATKGQELELVRILTTYTTIDLSCNRLTGNIPSIIGDLVALRVLNLSHNGLQGHIPASLGNLSFVESLDLSVNQLGGEIPQQLATVTSLEVLNLSHNHLQGCIPRGPQFATFEKTSYEGNDGLRGFPVSKGCGSYGAKETNSSVSMLDDQESDFQFLTEFFKAAIIGYGSGLCIGLSIVYFTISTGYPIWLSRIILKLEHKIVTQWRKKQRSQRNHKRRKNRI